MASLPTASPDGSLGEVMAWIHSWIWIPTLGLVAYLVLVFPDGRLPVSGWRWFARVGLFLTVAGAVAVAFSPGPVDADLGATHNPLKIEVCHAPTTQLRCYFLR